MMKANYHTHTWRCNHAEPDERAVALPVLTGAEDREISEGERDALLRVGGCEYRLVE